MLLAPPHIYSSNLLERLHRVTPYRMTTLANDWSVKTACKKLRKTFNVKNFVVIYVYNIFVVFL